MQIPLYEIVNPFMSSPSLAAIHSRIMRNRGCVRRNQRTLNFISYSGDYRSSSASHRENRCSLLASSAAKISSKVPRGRGR